MNRIPLYGCGLGAGESGSAGEVRASAGHGIHRPRRVTWWDKFSEA